MNTETKTLILSPGENLRLGQGRKYLLSKTQHMGPHTKIDAIAVGIVQRDHEQNADVLFQAGDAAGVGKSEAEQAENYSLVRYPKLKRKTFRDEKSHDTSTMGENAHDFIHHNNNNNEHPYERVVLVDPSFHMRRMAGNNEAWGVPLDGTYDAEKVYVDDPNITESTRRRRQRIVNKLYRSNPLMWGEKAREAILNVIGIIDNKGMITRTMTSRSRNNA